MQGSWIDRAIAHRELAVGAAVVLIQWIAAKRHPAGKARRQRSCNNLLTPGTGVCGITDFPK
jgi:hypothetical protein